MKSRVLLWDRDESDEEENLVYGPYAPYMPSRADEPSMCAERATPQPQSSRPLGPSELQVSMTNAVSSVVLDARHINLTWEPAETALPEMTASPVKIDLMWMGQLNDMEDGCQPTPRGILYIHSVHTQMYWLYWWYEGCLHFMYIW